MKEIILRPYQSKVIDDVINHLKINNRCCVSLATGGGKTIIFSNLVKHFQNFKILICVHREELVHQTSNTLPIEHNLIIPNHKNKQELNITVAMVQTLNNRIKKGLVNINDFDYVIVDECHRGEFMKVIDKSVYSNKLIGFTATPNYEKIETVSIGGEKYRQKVPLARYYDTLIKGIEINELIEQGYLVQDENFTLSNEDLGLLQEDNKGGYTDESQSLVFGSAKALQNSLDTYNEYCKGKKTIIFNTNTIVNRELCKLMVEQGINAKMYDSQNSDEHRAELIEWFKNTNGAVLLNVQIFTTGFDCTDVEVVFLNKKTKSINLFLQMVGRGGRITDKIFKPTFRVIDLGANIEDFGKWSAPRNWDVYFTNSERKKVGKPQPEKTRICHVCEAINSANSLVCFKCGAEKRYTNANSVVGIPKREGKFILPPANAVVDYCTKNNLTTLQAKKIVYGYLVEMIKGYDYDKFEKNLLNGALWKRLNELLRPYYFAIQKSELEGNRNKTMHNFIGNSIEAMKKYYSQQI
jgi:superfamily II DNA or RNA helicase